MVEQKKLKLGDVAMLDKNKIIHGLIENKNFNIKLNNKNNLDKFSENLISINGLGNKAVDSIINYFVNNISEFNNLCSYINLEELIEIKKFLLNQQNIFTE